MELTVFRSMMELGAKLLGLYFSWRAAEPDGVVCSPDGSPARLHSWQERRYVSVFGEVPLRRRYYRLAGGGGTCPLDAALSLPKRCYSDLLRDWLEFALTHDAYDQAAAFLERILGFSVAKHALERLAAADAADVTAFYEQQPAPPIEAEASILVVQVDGKGVRMVVETDDGVRRTEKKEAVVTGTYTIAPHQADAEAIVDTLAGKPVDTAHVAAKQPRPAPVGKELRATLAGKDVAFERLVRAVSRRDGPHIRHRVALTDGAQALQERVGSYLPGFTLILDLVHVKDYVRDASAALLGEDYPLLQDFIACRLWELLTGRLERVLDIFEDRRHLLRPLSPADERVIATTLGYLRRNAEFMHYDIYLAQGWPIATGVIEGACGHLVKQRMEGAGIEVATARRPGGARPA